MGLPLFDNLYGAPELLVPGAKPTGPVEVDFTDPLAYDLVEALVINESGGPLRSIIGDKSATPTGAPAWGAGEKGTHRTYTTSDVDTLAREDKYDITGAMTFLITMRSSIGAADASWRFPFGKRDLGDGNADFAFNFKNSTPKIQFHWASANTFEITALAETVPTDEWVTYVCSRDASDDGYIDKNGVQVASATGLATATSSTAGITIAGNPDISEDWSGDIALILLWNRFLTKTERAEIYNAPNRVLKPANSGLWLPEIIGGATTYFQTNLGSLTPSGALTKKTLKEVLGSLTPAGVISKKTLKELAGSITPSGLLNKKTLKTLLGSLTPTGALSASIIFTQAIAGSLSPSGAIAKKTKKSLVGSLTIAGALSKKTLKSLSGSLTLTGALIKKTTRTLTGSITPSGLLALAYTTTQSIVGSITASGAVTTVKGIAASGVAFLRPIYYKIVRKIYRKSVNESKR